MNKKEYKLPDNFPDYFLNTGISLQVIGLNSFAWKFPLVLEVITFLERENYVILGGDVLLYNGEHIENTYDSWYFNIDESLTKEQNIKQSVLLADQYLKKYNETNNGEFLYNLVVRSLA